MAQWRHLEELSRTNKDISERIDFIYKGESFIFKIRTLCADFIEKENGMGSASDEAVVPQDLFRGLLGSLEDMGQCGDLKHKMSIKHDIQALKAMSEEAAYQFAQVMKNCMKQEQQLIQSFLCQDDGRHSCMQNVAKENEKITSEINQTAQSLMNLEQKVDQLEKEQDSFNLVHQELTADIGKVAAEVNKAGEVKRLEEQKTALIQNLYCNRTIVAGLLEEMDGPLGGLFDNIWADIDTWKTQQSLQITGIAKPLEGIMDVLGQMCERAGDLLCATQRLAEKILNIYEQLPFQNDPLVAKVTEITGHLDVLLQKHVTKIFVVDKPPPQVIKVVNTKSNVFSMGVRLLGAASLGLHMTMPKVTAELFREKDFEKALDGQQVKGMCQVTNGKDKTMELTKKAKSGCSTKTGALKADFAKVCLEKAQRTERSKDEWVTDNKYFMVFYTQIMLHNKPMQLVVYSRPIILISHVLQDCTAKATLIWNAAFPLENGKPYEEQKEVPWSKVAEVLDALFFVNTERHLMPDQLNYLASIAFRKRDVNTNFSEMMISRNKLLKDHLHKAKNKEKENSSRNFSFWKWFYANMNLLKERLKQEWKDGIIYGFVSKDTAKQLLSDQPNGTFLLRFSESSIEASMKADICGCITVAVITRNPATGDRDVFHVKDHLATKDIMMSSLAQILDSFEVDDELGRKQRLLHYLWPAKPLEEVFKTYLPQHENEDSTYKRGRVTITILLCSDSSHLRHASNMPMSPFSAVSDLDDMSVASPGSAVSVQSQGIQSPIMTVPPPSNIVTISNASGVFSQLPSHIEPHVGESDEAFVPGRIALQEINLEEINSCLQQLSNGDVMLNPDFQMDTM